MKKVTNLRDQFFTVPHFDILRSEQVFNDEQKILKFPAKIFQNDTAFFRVFQNQIDSCIFSMYNIHSSFGRAHFILDSKVLGSNPNGRASFLSICARSGQINAVSIYVRLGFIIYLVSNYQKHKASTNNSRLHYIKI